MHGPFLAIACALAAVAAPAIAGETSIHRLADAFAREVQRVTAGQSAAVQPPDDQTGRGGTLASDLHALIRTRLGPAGVPDAPRFRIAPVLSETKGRLTLSARVLTPDGRFVDVLTASVNTDDGALALYAARAIPQAAAADVLLSAKTPWDGGAILDMALLGPDRLLVLTPEDVRLFSVVDGRVESLSRLSFPGPFSPVRSPGGIVSWVPGDPTAWVMTSRTPRAFLVGLDGDRLLIRETAGALPWPGVPRGLRFREGTNLIELERRDRAQAVVLAARRGADDDAFVTPDGRLLFAETDGVLPLAVGPPIALLGRGLLAVTSAAPPGPTDTIRLVQRLGTEMKVVDTVTAEGAVRSLAGVRHGDGLRLAAALERPGGARDLWLLDLRLHQP